VLNTYPAQLDESAPILLKTLFQQSFLHSMTTVSNFKINCGGVVKMRVIVLRKQQEGVPAEELPSEVQQEVEEVMRERQEVFDEISESIGELNRTIIDNFNQISVETLERIRDLLQEAVNTASAGATAGAFRKGEIAIITDTDLDALEKLAEALERLTHPEEGAPALSEERAKELLKLVRKAKKSLQVIEKQLREGIIKVEEELRKQLEEEEEEGLYSPDDIIEREKEKIRPIEGLVFSLKEEMTDLRKDLDDIEDNAELLAIPAERDVFVEEGWFEEKVRSIRSHVLEIAELGMELVRKLAELGGVEIRGPWKR
jgi:uncharacterized protein Yka (UPF0111/DUF47 family)